MASRYVLSLLAAALIGGILTGLLPGGGCGKLLRLLCGVFLLTAVLKPLGTLKLPDLDAWLSQQDQAAQAAAAMGEAYLRAEKQQVISQRLKAYILDKATGLGMALTVELTLDEEGCPKAAALKGTYTQSQRTRMETILEADLGIPKECQRWDEES